MNMLTPKLFYCKKNDYYKYMYTLLKDKNFAKKKTKQNICSCLFPYQAIIGCPFQFCSLFRDSF